MQPERADMKEDLGALSGSQATPGAAEEASPPVGFDPARVSALEKIVRDTLWMAQRYADGRMTYAVGLYNDAAEVAMKLGVVPVSSDLFARDGMFASEVDPDALTGCADDQIWADVPVEALRNAIAAGTQSAETSETSAPSEGCQSGPKGIAQGPSQ